MTNKHLKIKPSNILRIIYATPLNVHKHETGLTLDLSYVTDRIIVCSYPVLRFPKLMYRNSLEDLVTFLNIHHGPENWTIFNFKAEIGSSDYKDEEVRNIANRWYISQSAKVITDFHDEQTEKLVHRLGWMDHCPPPFLLLQHIVDEMHNRISRSQSAVVVLHCRVGKGRSGTISIAYMMKYLDCPLAEARDVFMTNRFRPGVSRGVVIPSQLRYLRYHEMYLCYDLGSRNSFLANCAMAEFKLKSINLIQPSSVILSGHCVAYIKIQKYNSDRNDVITVATLETDEDLLGRPMGGALSMCLPLELEVSDIQLEFGITSKTSHMINNIGAFASRSHCWLNLYCEILRSNGASSLAPVTLEELRKLQDEGQEFSFNIRWNELDGAKGTSNRGIKLFESMTLKWSLL